MSDDAPFPPAIGSLTPDSWLKLNPPPIPKVVEGSPYLVQSALNSWSLIGYKELTNAELRAAEKEPFGGDRQLLYALRVSHGITSWRDMKALSATWRHAMLGPDPDSRRGGIMSVSEGDCKRRCEDFVKKLFLWKCRHICFGLMHDSDLSASSRKTCEARVKIFQRSLDKVEGWKKLFSPDLPGSSEIIDRTAEALKGRILAADVRPFIDQPKKEKT